MVKVSIISIAYNQEKFIRQTLEGFVAQKTNFAFEVIIHDDASTDKTADIIREYAEKYPDIIKPIFEKENQYSKGPYDFINDMFMAAKGEYVAWCEGDDYWSDPDKLQLQVDFMESHPAYALCFHPVKVIFEDKSKKSFIYPSKEKTKFNVDELLMDNFIQSNSVLYRRQDYGNMPNDIMPHDWYLHLYHAQFGKIGFIDRVMSVYRRHSGGVWWDTVQDRDRFWQKQGLKHLGMYSMLLNMYGDNSKRRAIINQTAARTLEALFELAARDPEPLKAAFARYPDMFTEFVAIKNKLIDEQADVIKAIQQHVDHLEEAVTLKDKHIQNLEAELHTIKSSRTWKALKGAKSIGRRG